MSSTSGRNILIIDDDKKLCRLISEYLGPLGYSVEASHTGPEGIEKASSADWHAIILDVMLPGMDGFEVLRQLRASSDVPVLMLTARGDETDRIVGLEVGADDYLPKTFSTRELLARLRAVTRRSSRTARGDGDPDIVVGPLNVSPSTRSASLDGRSLSLTPVEFDLLLSLVRSAGRVKTRDRLLEEIRDREYEVFDRSVDVHISSLRKKLGEDVRNPRFIHTLRSAGYLLQDPSK